MTYLPTYQSVILIVIAFGIILLSLLNFKKILRSYILWDISISNKILRFLNKKKMKEKRNKKAIIIIFSLFFLVLLGMGFNIHLAYNDGLKTGYNIGVWAMEFDINTCYLIENGSLYSIPVYTSKYSCEYYGLIRDLNLSTGVSK